jgi:glycosyltransferase involved in cell wall biosynthesis
LRSELGLSSCALVGAVARLEEQKGLRYLIEAARSVLDQGQEVHFVVVGDGPLRPALQGMINELGLDRHISLLGRRDDMSNIYASLDLLVMPSLDEGLPMVLLEAMGAGVPVIATPVGAVPRLLHDGETGLLVEPRDVAGLRDAILTMLRQPEFAMTMAVAGRALVRNYFSADAMAGQYANLYSNLLRSTQMEAITA